MIRTLSLIPFFVLLFLYSSTARGLFQLVLYVWQRKIYLSAFFSQASKYGLKPRTQLILPVICQMFKFTGPLAQDPKEMILIQIIANFLLSLHSMDGNFMNREK